MQIYFFLSFPRQYGELLVSCGLIGEAVKVFEDLELWDNLIYCYRYDGGIFSVIHHLCIILALYYADGDLMCNIFNTTAC